MRVVRRSRMFPVLVSAVLILASCSSADQASTSSTQAPSSDVQSTVTTQAETSTTTTVSSPEPTPEPTHIVFALPVARPDEGQVWAYVPEAAGFFAEENLIVEFVPNDGGSAALRQVAAGNADFSVSNPEALVNAVAEGLDLRGVATLITRQIHGVRTLADSGISSYEDLRGGSLAVSSFTSGAFFFAQFALAENGLTPDVDVEFVTTGSGAPMLAAAQSGDVDAFAVWDTQVAGFEQLGAKIITLPSSRTDLPSDLLIVRSELAESNPDVVARFARAVVKGIVFAQANPDAAVQMFLETFPEAAETGTVELSLILLNARLSNMLQSDSQERWGDIPLADYQALLEADMALGIITGLPDDFGAVFNTDLQDQIGKFDVSEVEALARNWG